MRIPFRIMLMLSIAAGLLIQAGQARARELKGDVLLTGVSAVAASETHTCALTTGGLVRCWGDNTYGQLGDGTLTDRKTPVYVSGLNQVTAITVGRYHTCALTSAGGVKCWGANGYGQLGNGSNFASLTPVAVSNLANVTAIDAGSYFTCALTSVGGMKCWGYNYYGQLGDGTNTDRPDPVSIFANGISSISAGWAHTCAVTTNDGAKCWGLNGRGQLGLGSTGGQHYSPAMVSGLNSGVTSISAGGYHTCAMVSGMVKCWGWNFFGQLGDTTTLQRTEPVNVFWLGSAPAAISAGGNHTCALNTDGGVNCWGSNTNGQLGDGTTDQHKAPVAVTGLSSGVALVSSGYIHTCAVMDPGGVKCWGYNGDGQLGIGTTNDSHTPVNVVAPRLTIRSTAGRDGWVLESSENSSVGGSLTTDGNLRVGDDNSDRQYRSLLYFNTALLPDNAILLKVTLKIRSSDITGTDPFTTHGQLRADIKEGTFGEGVLENGDFQAAASLNNTGNFSLFGASLDWYKIALGAAKFQYVNLTGVTQFRLRFATGDNDDAGADYMEFYSGEAAVANRPQLIIEYVLP